MVGQIDNRGNRIIIAPKKSWAPVQSLSYEGTRIWYTWHASQSIRLCLQICLVDCGAVRVVIIRVGRSVSNKKYVDAAVEKGPDWNVLVALASVNEVQFRWLAGEGIGIWREDSAFVCGHRNMKYVLRDICDVLKLCGDGTRNSQTDTIEDVRRAAHDIAQIVVACNAAIVS